jgi:hypothetical protein
VQDTRQEQKREESENPAADQSVYSKGTNKTQISAYEKALHPKLHQPPNLSSKKDEDLLSPDIVDIKTKSHQKQQQ